MSSYGRTNTALASRASSCARAIRHRVKVFEANPSPRREAREAGNVDEVLTFPFLKVPIRDAAYK